MCDFFSDKGGDLADVVRNVTAAAGLPSTTSTSSSSETATASWQFPVADSAAAACFQQLLSDDYAGDSYNLRDPLLHELMGTTFFEGEVSDRSGGSDMSGIIPIKPLPIIGMGDYGKEDHGLSQILSPRAPGIKRRKSQAKKVVCIPAPAAASSRPSGEVVPSDLWAWRKYGQKPIKGSPYPRGYYRCSSSKGCSARKQVERSRHDPNMLVITYTSEHNHPWPTQRNALAGSTRSQPSKNSTPISSSSSSLMEEPTSENSSSLPAVKEEEAAEMENHINDFFADLVELDADPMSLIFFKNRTGESGGQGWK